jgi:hypothetical protein
MRCALRAPLVALALCLILEAGSASAWAANAKVVLKTGSMESRFEEFGRWSLAENVIDGRQYSYGTQGTVIHVGGSWAGSRHEREEVLDVTMTVDGIERDVIHGAVYEGNQAVVHRQTIVGEVIGLDATMTLTEDRIVEQVTFTMLEEASPSIYYGLLYAYNPRFEQYKGFAADGELMRQGQLTDDDGSYHYLSGLNDQGEYIEAVAAALYDADTGDALVTWVEPSIWTKLYLFLVDRSDTHKLYHRLLAMEQTLPAGHTFSLTMTTEFYQYSQQEWDELTQSPLAPVPEPTVGLLLLAGAGVFTMRRRLGKGGPDDAR